MKTKRTEGESCLNFRRRRRRSSVFGEMRRSSHFSASMPATSCSLMRHHQLTSLPIGYTHKEQLYILSHLVSQVKSGQLASGTERKLLRLFLITFLNKWRKNDFLCKHLPTCKMVKIWPSIYILFWLVGRLLLFVATCQLEIHHSWKSVSIISRRWEFEISRNYSRGRVFPRFRGSWGRRVLWSV